MKSIYRACAPVIAAVFVVSCAVSPQLTRDGVRIVDTKRGKMVELPEGLKIHSVLETPLSSTGSRAGERFYVRTSEPVTLDGKTIIPFGTRITGTVKAVAPPKGGLLPAKIDLSFNTINLGGADYPFHSKADVDKSDMMKEGIQLGGDEAAKAGIAVAFPPLEALFIAGDVAKGYKYYKKPKDETLKTGTRIAVKVNQPVYIPLR